MVSASLLLPAGKPQQALWPTYRVQTISGVYNERGKKMKVLGEIVPQCFLQILVAKEWAGNRVNTTKCLLQL